MTASDTTTTQGELEKLVSDLRGLLANKDLDAVPEIKLLRQRLDDGMHNVRESAVRAAQDAARQAKEAALAADRYAHDEPWRVAGAALAAGALVGSPPARRSPRPSGLGCTTRGLRMNWLSLLGLEALVARWRANVIEGAIAAEDRMDLARLEWQDQKQRLQQMLVLTIVVAGLTVVALLMLSLAVT